MQDVILLCTTAAVFLFGFFIIRRVDTYIAENQQAIEEENRKNRSLIRIATETPILVDSIAPAMESCSWSNPCITFSISTGRTNHMLQRLREGTVDLLLLAEDTVQKPYSEFSSVRIPYQRGQIAASRSGFPIEDSEQLTAIVVLWNPMIPSQDRDRVVFALNNDVSVH